MTIADSDSSPLSNASAAGAASPQSPPPTAVLRPLFLGTGSEYFGIWIVNTLLIIITAGIYYPWARVRRLQFFARSTEVDGFRLSFTGVARQMLPGFSIALIAFFVYSIAETINPILSTILLALFGLVWPWLMRAALRFRLARTVWRGLPFAFTGSVRGAYASFIPAIVLAAVVAAMTALGALAESSDLADSLSISSDWPALMIAVVVIGIVAAILGLLFVPWIHFRLKRYQHNHLQFGDRKTQFTAGPALFYGLYLKTALIAFGIFLLMTAVTALIGGTDITRQLFGIDQPGGASAIVSILLTLVSVLSVILSWQIIAAFFVSRLHNLVWSHTIGNDFAFAAALRFWPFLRLRLLNLTLKILTLGLYIPFAQVAIARIKLESLALAVSIDLDALIVQAQQNRVSAGADAAADLFDMDLGL